MDKQNDVTQAMRAILMDWLVEVQEEFRMQPETLYLAHNFIDRYLSLECVQRTRLQLLGVTSIFIATKLEECFSPRVKEFVYITDNAYSERDVRDKTIVLCFAYI